MLTRPSVARALAWRPEALLRLAEAWEGVARELHAQVEAVAVAVPADWQGAVADEAHRRAADHCAHGDRMARALIMAAVAARDGAGQLALARDLVAALVRNAADEGLTVADDGTVTRAQSPSPLLIVLAGGDGDVAADALATRAVDLSKRLATALDRLAAADDDAARDIAEATAHAAAPAVATVPAGAAGVDDEAWPARFAENRERIAQAVLDTPTDGRRAGKRIAFLESLLGEVDDPSGSGARIDRQILTFDPAEHALVEVNGDLATADSVAVFVPGMNTLLEESAADTDMARRFVTGSRGRLAAITFLGGEFPQDENPVVALVEAANPRYALDMAPRLAAFSHDLDRVIDDSGRDMAVTYVGHSYGGAILGTAEALGLTADRTLYVAAAGAGSGVHDPSDWHNGNPDVVRYSMTAPTDPIQLVQGSPLSPYGADPDRMPGVVHLATGRYDDGRPMVGLTAHTDVLENQRSQAWRNVLAVICGDRDWVAA